MRDHRCTTPLSARSGDVLRWSQGPNPRDEHGSLVLKVTAAPDEERDYHHPEHEYGEGWVALECVICHPGWPREDPFPYVDERPRRLALPLFEALEIIEGGKV